MALVIGTLVGLLFAEVVLRFLGVSYPQLYLPDEYCASRLRPGAEGYWLKEGRAFVRINSDGLRDEEHTIPKPLNTYRIALLGDSYCEALQVDVKDTFWAITEESLQEDLADRGLETEIINFGVSGYGTAQQLQMLRHYVWKYEPDLVLLAFCHNDLIENSRELCGVEAKPYFLLQNDELVLDDSFRQSEPYLIANTPYEHRKAWLVNQCYLLQVLKQVKLAWQMRNVPRIPEAGATAFCDGNMVTGANVYGKPESDAEKNAWETTERLIVELDNQAQMHDVEFAVVTVSTPLQAYPDPSVRKRALDEGIQDLFYVENRLRDLGKQHGFPVLTLAPAMQAHAEGTGEYLHGFSNTRLGTGHWNKAGHRLVAKELTPWLKTILEAR